MVPARSGIKKLIIPITPAIHPHQDITLDLGWNKMINGDEIVYNGSRFKVERADLANGSEATARIKPSRAESQ